MTWRPPSARNGPHDRFDQLHEGVPSWLRQPLMRWTMDFITSFHPMEVEPYYDIEVMRDIEMAVRFDPPLNWSRAESAAQSIAQRFVENSPEAIDVLDFLLHRLEPDTVWDNRASNLKRILDSG